MFQKITPKVISGKKLVIVKITLIKVLYLHFLWWFFLETMQDIIIDLQSWIYFFEGHSVEIAVFYTIVLFVATRSLIHCKFLPWGSFS